MLSLLTGELVGKLNVIEAKRRKIRPIVLRAREIGGERDQGPCMAVTWPVK
jgi:hypothetical protein